MKDLIYLIIPAIFGGIVDYLNQLVRGIRSFSICEFLVHISSAAFFGWMIGMVASGFGYPSTIVAAAGGFGGFLGVRIADIAIYKLKYDG